nr:MAG TPA: hypothetical protein [Caudoviricetes sp.]
MLFRVKNRFTISLIDFSLLGLKDGYAYYRHEDAFIRMFKRKV